MPARIRTFKLNQRGIGELLRSDSVQADLIRRAEAVAAAAGEGHDVKNTSTKRGRATVMTKTNAAMQAEATSHTLTAAIGAARR